MQDFRDFECNKSFSRSEAMFNKKIPNKQILKRAGECI